MPEFFDTHAHIYYPDFAAELSDVIARAVEAGITRVVAIGTNEETSRACLALADRFPGVYAAVGWHPSDAGEAPEDVRPMLRELAQHRKVVALGETGLDFYRLPGKQRGGSPAEDESCKKRQITLFRQHLEVAAELGLNCVIHERDSFDAIIPVLADYAARVRGVFHCFSKDAAGLRTVLELGSIVSFTGILTFKNAQSVREALAAAPPGKFMFETDSPYLAPVPYRGKRCEPAYVREIAEAGAHVRGCSLEELSKVTCDTAREFFRGLK